MSIFDVPEASYYCKHFKGSAGDAASSFLDYGDAHLKSNKVLTEGSPAFDAFRDCSLREVERSVFLAASLYRRSFDLMTPAAASWAHVSLYYCTFLAARALLAMFGASVLRGTWIVEVSASNPGSQRLHVCKRKSTYGGSHRQFWDFYYQSVSQLLPWTEPAERLAITPVSGQVTWLIDTRNRLNYDSFEAVTISSSFVRSYRKSRFPASLPGVLNTQFGVSEALLRLTCGFLRQFGIHTDALDMVGSRTARRDKLRELIYDAELPGIGGKARRRGIIV